MVQSRTERLLNLLFALLSARRPVSRGTIRSSVAGYESCASDSAFERMFERDKDELRSMGIPVETVVNHAGEVEGYLVHRDAYELPAVSFTSAQMAVLTVAANVWRDAAMAPAALTALHKLQAAGADPTGPDDIALGARVASADAAFSPLVSAVRSRQAVSFQYRKPEQLSGDIRRVQPWGIASWQDLWYLVGYDMDREAVRVFRLSRITSSVKAIGKSGEFTVPDDLDVRATVQQMAGLPTVSLARIYCHADSAHGLRRRAESIEPAATGDVLTVSYRDELHFAAELAGYGAAVLPIEPISLRRAVHDRLQGVLGNVATSGAEPHDHPHNQSEQHHG